MLLNRQAVKQAVAAQGKQSSKEFVEALDRKVAEAITKAAANTRQKRLTQQDLL